MDQTEGDPSDSDPPPNPIVDNQPPQCEAEELAVLAQGMELESKQDDEVEDPAAAAADVDAAGAVVAEAEEVAEPSPDVIVKTVAGGKRKRGRPPKSQTAKQPVKKKENEEEEVCFICFDGGNLVCCDRRGCTKVYHAACVNRDEAFFQTKGKWNCGWHICSICEKAAQYMCYTCTYSLCRGCIKGKGFVCVRGNKGFCETCFGTVMLIESKSHANEGKVGINFDDKNSFECLFKEYWFDVKRRLSLSLGELENAKVPFKGPSAHVRKGDSSSDELYDGNDEEEASSDSSSGRREGGASSRKKVRRSSRATIAEESSSMQQVDNVEISFPEDTEWASKELLEFVAHMKGGDKSVLSQFDVQALLLEYIKQNNLRDPRRKSQIICDPRLENLFGKARVGHFEMLKLLESHFLIKEAPQVVTDDNQGGGVDLDSGQMDSEVYADGATKGLSDKRRKNRKKVEEREPQTNLDDYAAIDLHNIGLIYLRRNLMEDLLDDVDKFTEKVVGSFVRIRIPSTGQKQDMYRLVQVVGTSKAEERYKTGRKTTDFILEILNLNKKEVITIDTVSNQDFTEEECKRLRQSIKCGLISRLTVGDIFEKAMALQSVRVNDWLESEKQRLGHLRDRASETGRRKDLRECVEKLQLLSKPEECTRRLNEVPEIHSDPKMDPDNESVDEEESDDKNKDVFNRPWDSSLRRGKISLSPGRGGPTPSNWAGGRKGPSSARDSNRNARTESARGKLEQFNILTDGTNEPATWNQEKDVLRCNSWETGTGPSNTSGLEATVWNNNLPAIGPGQSHGGPGQSHGVTSETTATPLTSDDPNETQKIWQYKDPAGKIQGPFSMVQLRKWNVTGYFPVDLKIWRVSESEEDSVLLSDALMGKFEKELPQWEPPQSTYSHSSTVSAGTAGQPNEQGSSWRQNSSLAPVGNNPNSSIWTGTGNIERQNADSWASESLTGYAPRGEVVIPREVRSGIPPRVWEPPRDTNAWSGQPQTLSSQIPVAPFYGNQHGPPPYQGAGVQGVGNAGSWNPGQDNRSNWSSSNSRMLQSAGQGYGQQHANWGSSGQQSSNKNQWGNGSHTLPTPVAQPTSQVWGTAQGTINVAASPMPSVQPMGTGWGSGNSPALPTSSVHPMGTGWGTLNMPASPTPFRPMGTGWGSTSGAWMNGGLQSAAASMEQNRAAAPGVNRIGRTAAWASNTASTSKLPNQIIGTNPAHVLPRQQTDTLNVKGNYSAVFPRNEVISPSNPSGLGFSTPIEHSSDVCKNQFFESGCPSPTPGSERHELPAVQLNELDTGKSWPEANERLGSDPTPLSPTPGMSNRPNVVESGALKLGSSSSVELDPQDNMSPIRDTETKPFPPALITKPFDKSDDSSSSKKQDPDGQIHIPTPSGHGWELNQTSKQEAGLQKPGHVETGNLEGPRDTTSGDMWSLPSPTPATQPSGWNVGSVPPAANSQNSPLSSFDGPKLISSSQPLAGSFAEQSHRGNMGAGPAKGDLNAGLGTVIGGENMALGASALGNANPSQGWGTWQEHMNMTADRPAAAAAAEDGKNSGWGTGATEGSSNAYPGWGTANQNTGWRSGEEDTNDWSTQQNLDVDEYRGGHGRDSRYESRHGNYSRRGSDSRHDSRYAVDLRHGGDSRYHSRYGGDSRHGSWNGGDSRYDCRHDGGRGQRNDRMHRDWGGRSSRTPPIGEAQGQGICKFHESGHCKKGASCNYVHS